MATKVNELNNKAQSTLTQLKRIIDDLKGCEGNECLPVLHGLEVQLGELSNRSHVYGSAITFQKIRRDKEVAPLSWTEFDLP